MHVCILHVYNIYVYIYVCICIYRQDYRTLYLHDFLLSYTKNCRRCPGPRVLSDASSPGDIFSTWEVDRSKGRITLSGGLGGNLTLLVDDYMGLHTGIIMIIILHSSPGTALPCSALLQIVDPGAACVGCYTRSGQGFYKEDAKKIWHNARAPAAPSYGQVQNHCWL